MYSFQTLNIAEVEIISSWLMSEDEGNIDMDTYFKSAKRKDEPLKGPGNCLGYAVFDDGGNLVGLFEFYPKRLDFEIGLAMAPDLRGLGKGLKFVEAGIEFGLKLFPKAKNIFLEVRDRNYAAIKIYKALNFVETSEKDGSLKMKKKLKKD